MSDAELGALERAWLTTTGQTELEAASRARARAGLCPGVERLGAVVGRTRLESGLETYSREPSSLHPRHVPSSRPGTCGHCNRELTGRVLAMRRAHRAASGSSLSTGARLDAILEVDAILADLAPGATEREKRRRLREERAYQWSITSHGRKVWQAAVRERLGPTPAARLDAPLFAPPGGSSDG